MTKAQIEKKITQLTAEIATVEQTITELNATAEEAGRNLQTALTAKLFERPGSAQLFLDAKARHKSVLEQLKAAQDTRTALRQQRRDLESEQLAAAQTESVAQAAKARQAADQAFAEFEKTIALAAVQAEAAIAAGTNSHAAASTAGGHKGLTPKARVVALIEQHLGVFHLPGIERPRFRQSNVPDAVTVDHVPGVPQTGRPEGAR
jgi:hypothetical protein